MTGSLMVRLSRTVGTASRFCAAPGLGHTNATIARKLTILVYRSARPSKDAGIADTVGTRTVYPNIRKLTKLGHYQTSISGYDSTTMDRARKVIGVDRKCSGDGVRRQDGAVRAGALRITPLEGSPIQLWRLIGFAFEITPVRGSGTGRM